MRVLPKHGMSLDAASLGAGRLLSPEHPMSMHFPKQASLSNYPDRFHRASALPVPSQEAPRFGAGQTGGVKSLLAPVLQMVFGPEDARNSWNYGPQVVGNKTRFRAWAPVATKVELLRFSPEKTDAAGNAKPLDQRLESITEMEPDGQGNFYAQFDKNLTGSLYMYRLTRKDFSQSRWLPDMFSRFQPEDVHGPSEVIKITPNKPSRFDLTPFDKRKASVYHLHIGTFTPEGTFESTIQKLDYLKEKGYTHVKLMPVDEFSGKWNWGYDGVYKQAVENAYGTPAQFKKLVDECKKRDLRVIADVVYNHMGPEGNYLKEYDPGLLHSGGPWGDTFNWDHPVAMNYVLRSLEILAQDYGVNGFRFDMASRIPDQAIRTITSHLKKLNPALMLIAEDERTSNHVTMPVEHGGLGLWGKHNFAWHHRIKGLATGHSHMDSPFDLKSVSWILEEGFPGPANQANSLHDLVNFFESHDEIGNHDGQRTSTKISRDKFLMASAIKYAVPGIVWNFQGEESYAQTPFYFFVNHSDKAVIDGTREGRKYSPQPDCMAPSNFTQSKLQWEKLDAGAMKATAALNKLRQTIPALWQGDHQEMQIDRRYLSSGVLVIRRSGKENPEDKAVIVLNTSDYHYKDNYQIQFSQIQPEAALDGTVTRRAFNGQNPKDWQGEWEEVYNQQAAEFGGNGWTNAGKRIQDQTALTLPGNSLMIFRKKASK